MNKFPQSFQAVDPASGEIFAAYTPTPPESVWSGLENSHRAYLEWSRRSVAERAGLLTEVGRLLRERKDEYGVLMTREMGKPLGQAIGEAEKCAWVCDYYAEHAERFLAPVPAPTDATRSYWTHRPLGVVLGIMPWNFPFWQAIRYAVPTLTAGNAALLKHAPNVPGCAEALEGLFRDAGYPEGLFRNLYVDLETTGSLIDHRLVRAVSLTGSVRAGRSVAERAGRALKPCVLELGGSDPSLVLADADLDLAVTNCVAGRMLNAGQSCIASKRFLVVDAVRDTFESMLLERVSALRMGDPMDPSSDIGPMARVDLRDALHHQVVRSVESGAALALGGVVPDRPGAWYPPTVLTGVRAGSPAYDEELFGPVASVLPVTDEAEAIRVANDTSFGLGASIYTRDAARGEHIAAEMIDAGNCFVNGFVKSDPRLPFGGVKDSGFGRELSPLGITEFTNTKTVWVR